MAGPATNLVVLVNGLYGFQRDWAQMKKALEAQNDGSYLIHVSDVNTGSQTYSGIDVCGQRLAQEVQQLVGATPSLTTISFMGHSMGGLIARCAIGLLTDPSSSTVAGLEPCCYISIATPHLGCSSSHPEEVQWQDRPYMRWLAAAVAAGHLGGHEHLAVPPAAAAVATTATAVAAAAAATGVAESEPESVQTAAEVAGVATAADSSSSRSWPWTPGRSVVQLLGCDSWQPLPELLQRTASACTDPDSQTAPAEGVKLSTAQSEGEGSADCIVQCADGVISSTDDSPLTAGRAEGAGMSTDSCCCCRCEVPQMQLAWAKSRPSDSSSSSSSNSSSSGGSGGAGARGASAEAVTGPVHLLDALCRDVLVTCRRCGACRTVCFLSGLSAFKHRLTYSSAGGDHLIPWSSGALLHPNQLPVRATKQAAAAAAAADADSGQPLQLPVLGLWATKPAIVEQSVRPDRHQQQQQQQQQKEQCEQGGDDGASAPALAQQGAGPASSHDTTGQQQQPQQPQQQQQELLAVSTPTQHTKSSRGTSSSSSSQAQIEVRSQAEKEGGPAAVDTGLLRARLHQLQCMEWRRMHVVWPRLCLGSSHCNIQYNGPLNFVGQAVVAHVCQQLLQS